MSTATRVVFLMTLLTASSVHFETSLSAWPLVFVAFRLVFYGSIMAKSSPAEERQLFLMENMNRRLDSILESQKKLKEANAAVQQDNVTRKTGATK